jgi:putative peptidoglycan lipid II flippase
MAIGSVSVFQFAFNLQSVPLAIIGVSYSVAAFPLLAQLYAERKYTEFSRSIMNALRHILFWSLPVVALIIVIRAQFVRVILGSGAFDWSDTRLTAAILSLFALSLAAQSMHLLLVRGLYAAQNTRLPFYTTLFSSVLALVGAFGFHLLITTTVWFRELLQVLMRLEDVSGIEVLALPLGYSCALVVQVVFLILMSREELFISARVLFMTFIRGLIASFVGGFCSYTTLNFYAKGIEADTLLTIFLQGLLAGLVGICGAGAAYY